MIKSVAENNIPAQLLKKAKPHFGALNIVTNKSQFATNMHAEKKQDAAYSDSYVSPKTLKNATKLTKAFDGSPVKLSFTSGKVAQRKRIALSDMLSPQNL